MDRVPRANFLNVDGSPGAFLGYSFLAHLNFLFLFGLQLSRSRSPSPLRSGSPSKWAY